MPVISVNDLATFHEYLANNEFVLVDFYATWCGPCVRIAPLIEQFSNAEAYSKVVFLKVDVDRVPELTKEQEIECMPTFKFFVNGVVKTVIKGADPNAIAAAIGSV